MKFSTKKSWANAFAKNVIFTTFKYQRFCCLQQDVLYEECRLTLFLISLKEKSQGDEHSFRSLWPRKKKDKKCQIFDYNHRLTPLQKNANFSTSEYQLI